MRKLSVVWMITLGPAMFSLPAQSLADAYKLFREEQYTKAIVVLKQLLKTDPSNSEISYLIGKSYFENNIDDSAALFFEKTAVLSPVTPYTYLAKGRHALYNKNKAMAKEAFEEAININKKDPNIIIEAGDAAVKHDTSMIPWVKETFARYEKVCKKQWRYYVVLGDISQLQGSGGNAVSYYNQAKELDKKNPVIYMKIATIWQSARRYDLALQELETAEKIDPSFPPLLRELGEVKFLKGDFVSAKEYYARYLSLIGNDLEAKVKYAKFLFLSKLYDKAIEEINSILQVDQSAVVLYRLLGYSYYENKNYEEGLKAMEYFMKNQDPSKYMYADYTYYGRLLARNGKDSAAYQVLLKAYRMDTTDISVISDLIQTAYNRKAYDDAIYWQYKKINSYESFNMNEYMRLGQMYYVANNFTKADSIFALVAQKTDTNNINVIIWQARSRAGMDNQDKPKGLAKPYYQKILTLGNKDLNTYKKEVVEAYRYLGFYYFKNKNMTLAEQCFRKIKQIDPASPGVDNIIKQIEEIKKKQELARKKKQQEEEEEAELEYLK